MNNFTSNYQFNPLKNKNSNSQANMQANQMVKVVKNPMPKSGLGNHKKTKSTYVTAVAQMANGHGIGAQ